MANLFPKLIKSISQQIQKVKQNSSTRNMRKTTARDIIITLCKMNDAQNIFEKQPEKKEYYIEKNKHKNDRFLFRSEKSEEKHLHGLERKKNINPHFFIYQKCLSKKMVK